MKLNTNLNMVSSVCTPASAIPNGSSSCCLDITLEGDYTLMVGWWIMIRGDYPDMGWKSKIFLGMSPQVVDQPH